MSTAVAGRSDGWRDRARAWSVALPLVVVVVAPALASWHGLTAAGRDVLGLSGPWPVLVPLVFDAAAAYAAVLSLRSVLSGDSALTDRLLVWVYALGSAALNAWHAHAYTGGVPAAAFYGAASVSAVVLWDRTLRARRRDQLRELGAVEPPLPRFRMLRWAIRPRETWRAWSFAVAEGITSPASALWAVRDGDPVVQVPVEELAGVVPSPRAAVATAAADGPAEPDLTGLSKAECLRIAWRELGIAGVPETADVVPALEWCAARGVVVDRSRAYEVRRRLEASVTASRQRQLSLVSEGGK